MRVIHFFLPAVLLSCGCVSDASEGSFIAQITVPITPRGTGWEVDFEQMQVPVVVSGDMPGDILKALTMPIKLPSLLASYRANDANVISLCRIGLSGTFALEHYRIGIDLARFTTKPLGLEDGRVIEATIEAIRLSLRERIWNSKPIQIDFRLTGAPDRIDKFKHLERTITLEARNPKDALPK